VIDRYSSGHSAPIWSQSHLFTLFSCHMCFLRTRPIYFCLAFIGLSLALKTNHGAVGSPRPLAIGLEPILGQEAGQEEAQKVRQTNSSKFVKTRRTKRFLLFSPLVASFVFAKVRHESTQSSTTACPRSHRAGQYSLPISTLTWTSTSENRRTKGKVFVEKNLRRELRQETSSTEFARFSPNFSRIFTRFSASTASAHAPGDPHQVPDPQDKVQGQVGQHQIKVSQLGGGVAQSARRSQSCS
jgi:hypothetical protein